jgi:hypothetical protein
VRSSVPPRPFANWPIQLHDPRFGFAWYASPAVFVSCVVVEHGEAGTAEGLNDALDHIVETRAREIKAAGGLLVVQDFRMVKTYSSESRQVYVERMKRRPRGYSRGVFVAIEGANPLLRMAVETANLAFAIAIGGVIRVVSDPMKVLARFKVAVPERGDFGPASVGRLRRHVP